MKARAPLLALAALAVAACSSSASNVSPGASSGASAAAGTPRPSPAVRWTATTGGPIWGSVALRDGVVYVGSDDGSLYALDAASGAMKWKFETGGAIRTQPAFDGDNLLFSSDDGKLYAVKAASGTKVWQADIHNDLARPDLNNPKEVYDFDFLASSPVVANGLAFVGSSDGNVYGVEASGGSVRWTFKTGDKVRATPAIANGRVYVGSWDGYMYALDATRGELAWKYQGGDTAEPRYLYQPIQSSAVVADGVVYGASRKTKLFAVDAATGAEKWQAAIGPGNWFESSPVLAGERVYIGSSAASSLYAFDRKAGYPVGAVFVGGFAWSTPLIDGDAAYIGSEGDGNGRQGGLTSIVLDKMGTPLESRWSYPMNESADPSAFAGVNSSPVIDGRTIYFGGLDGQVYALDV